VKGKVVRCQVASISGGKLQYQSGIAFDARIALPDADTLREQLASASARSGAAVSSPSAPAAETRNRW
jgi:hypothetical protein